MKQPLKGKCRTCGSVVYLLNSNKWTHDIWGIVAHWLAPLPESQVQTNYALAGPSRGGK